MIDRAALKLHADRLTGADLGALVRQGGERDEILLKTAAGVTLDARKQRLDEEAWAELLKACAQAGFEDRRADLFAGRVVNETENRPAIHAALRDPSRLEDAALSDRIREAGAA